MQLYEIVRFTQSLNPQWKPTLSEDLFPLSPGLVIRLDSQGDRELVPMQWGFLPSWWKPSAKSASPQSYQRQCFNARSETAHEKPTYRSAFKTRRCLIPALQFEEKKCWFQMKDGQPFVMAGLWEMWQKEEQTIYSYTILTTEPCPLIRSVGHHRMPVILPDSPSQARWLSPDLIDRPPLEDLLQPYQENLQLVEDANGKLF